MVALSLCVQGLTVYSAWQEVGRKGAGGSAQAALPHPATHCIRWLAGKVPETFLIHVTACSMEAWQGDFSQNLALGMNSFEEQL